jgi:hypothetical protein
LALVLLGAEPAGAQVSGPCEATIAGQSVDEAASPGDAIEVDAEDDVVAGASSSEAMTDYEVDLEFGGFRWTVASGEVEGNSWEKTVKVSDYATFGVGLYKVHGVSLAGGDEVCTGTAYIDVGGKSPLTTVAGATGLAALVGGVALMATAGLRR